MNSDIPRARLSRTSRLLSVLAGIFLLVLGLGLGMLTYVLLFDKEPPGLGILALAGAIFAVTLWVLNLSRRLILGRPYPGGGLFSPFELRVLACSWIALPLMALLTGSWQKPGSPLALQWGVFLVRFAVAVLIAFILFQTASSRKARSRDMERHTSVEPPP